MGRERYRFDPNKLRYVRSEPGKLTRFIKSFLPSFFAGAVFSIFAALAVFQYGELPLPGNEHLQKENQRLLERYEDLKVQLEEVDQTLARVRERDDSLYRSIYGAEPIPENVRRSGIGGTDRYKHLKGTPYSELLVHTHSKLDQLDKQLRVQEESFEELMGLAREKKDFLTHIPAIRPIRSDRVNRVASGFGKRFHPVYRIFKMHEGVDFTVDVGTPIHATGDGVVKRVEKERAGYGRNMVIDHGHGYETLYAHLNRFKVKEGQKVKRGEVIGLSGNTGTSTGPHLHYEVIRNDKKVDPVDFFFNDLDPGEYEKVVKAAERSERSL